MRIFLDPVGGVAGDMFVAALLDAWPDLADELGAIVPALGAPDGVAIRIEPHRDGAMAGTRLRVEAPARGHDRYADVRSLLEGSRLDQAVKRRALAIFALLAEAESQVHGSAIDEVTFHEVGNWDSIVDVVCAAFLIEALKDYAWSVGSLPLGSGRVDTAHGLLPVPAPATVLLLEGFAVHDDGIAGERVTPTGAAILCNLRPAFASTMPTMRLARTGVAFGQRTLDGLSNVLRAFCLRAGDEGLARRRRGRHPVRDRTTRRRRTWPSGWGASWPRKASSTSCRAPSPARRDAWAPTSRSWPGPESMDGAIDACLAETTTIGLRWHLAHRSVLPRAVERLAGGDGDMRVKVASRPGGVATAKAEMDQVMAAGGGRAARAERRATAEAAALGRRRRDE